MEHEFPFRVALAIVAAGLIATRTYYGVRVARGASRVSARGASLLVPVLVLFGAGTVSASAYVFLPGSMNWSALPLAPWARWAGLGVGVAADLLFAWAHHALGTNWSVSVVLRAEHTLVTTGPYRLMRHPMYTAIFLWALAFFLLSANWFIGASWFALIVLAASRVPGEEALLIGRFGDAYRAYSARTGRFLPRLLH